MKRKLTSLLLAAVMAFGMLPALGTTSFAAGKEFSDVPKTAWYYSDVQNAVASGIVNGKSETTYEPDSNLTYAEAVTLASRINKYADDLEPAFKSTNPWYKAYIDYAVSKGMIDPMPADFDWNAPATRGDFIAIFSAALPEEPQRDGIETLRPKNRVDDGMIPDVPMSDPNANAIYLMYRAGIVQGSDAARNCLPDSNIKRSEVAAIITRMLDSSKRVSFTLSDGKASTLKIAQQPKDVTAAVGDKIVEFRVEVSGGKEPYSYQWQLQIADEGWNDVDDGLMGFFGSHTPSLTDEEVSQMAFYYKHTVRCVITDADGHKVVSEPAGYIEKSDEFRIETQPKDVTVKCGNWTTLEVKVAGGKEPYTYRWCAIPDDALTLGAAYGLENGETIRGADTDTLVLKADDVDINNLSFYCEIYDATEKKTLETDYAKINVTSEKLYVLAQTREIAGDPGEWVILSIEALGGKSPYKYVWEYSTGSENFDTCDPVYSDDDYFEGAGTKNLKVRLTENDFKLDMKYRCRITDANGDEVITAPISIKSKSAMSLCISEQPEDITAPAYTWVRVGVSVVGGYIKKTSDYKYSWQMRTSNSDWEDIKDTPGYFDSANMRGFNIMADLDDQVYGIEYRAAVSDLLGNTVYSEPFRINAYDAPLVAEFDYLDGTGYLNVYENQDVTLYCQASGGNGDYTYEWYFIKGFDSSNRYPVSEYGITDKGTNTLAFHTSKKFFEDKIEFVCFVKDSAGHIATTSYVQLKKQETPLQVRIANPLGFAKGAPYIPVEAEFEAYGGLKPYTYKFYYVESGSDTRLELKNHENDGKVSFRGGRDNSYVICEVTDKRGTKVESEPFYFKLSETLVVDESWNNTEIRCTSGKNGSSYGLSVAAYAKNHPLKYEWYMFLPDSLGGGKVSINTSTKKPFKVTEKARKYTKQYYKPGIDDKYYFVDYDRFEDGYCVFEFEKDETMCDHLEFRFPKEYDGARIYCKVTDTIDGKIKIIGPITLKIK